MMILIVSGEQFEEEEKSGGNGDSTFRYPTSSEEKRAGNGSLMRLSPIVLAFANYDPNNEVIKLL